MFGNKRDLVDSEVIKKMREKLAALAYETDSFESAYRSALRDYWIGKFEPHFGRYFNSKIKNAVAKIRFSDGVAELQIVDIRIGYDFSPEVVVHQRIKSGRWGKTEYCYHVEYIINNILSVEK